MTLQPARELRVVWWFRKVRVYAWMYRVHVWPEYPLHEQAVIIYDFLLGRRR